MGYQTDFVSGQTTKLYLGLQNGYVDIYMESWTENYKEAYDKALNSGSVIDLGPNYTDNFQGWMVPSYMIKGDPMRGIDPVAPDLKTVKDISQYWKLFQDPDDPAKGRFYNSLRGLDSTRINEKKIEAYGLNKNFNQFIPDSEEALSGSLTVAYMFAKPWFGYYESPSWVLGRMDMTPLKEPPYDKEIWQTTNGCAYPSVQVNKLINIQLQKRAPDVVEFLKKYQTTATINNKFLAYMHNAGATTEQAAIWFLKNYELLWTNWVSQKVTIKVKHSLYGIPVDPFELEGK
jgi:glycine betaine/proline transport system substrate-binding protein